MPGIDITCDGAEEPDGTFSVTLSLKGFETKEHAMRAGNYLHKPAHEAIAHAAPNKRGIIRAKDVVPH